MRSVGVLLENVGLGGATELACSVQEEDWQRGETYSARWRSVSLLGPRPQERQSVSETEPWHGQTFSRKWAARNLLLRWLPGGALWREGAADRPQPNVRAPLLGPRGSPLLPQALPEAVVRCKVMPRRCVVVGAPRAVTTVKKDVAPERSSTEASFTKTQKSLGRLLSQEAQRG